MSRRLDDLDSRIKPKAIELIARCAEALIPVMIITTSRTYEEQKDAVARGVSWTMNSKHLPQPPENKSLAIDVVPYAIYQIAGPDKLQWNESDPVWAKIGAIGQALGLQWGVTINGVHKDLGHFQFIG